MNIKFCGASSGVTGSCHLLVTAKSKILLDCGQFQGGKANEKLNYEDFPFDPKEIDCVVLSHAHIDHCGRLPLLVKRGFSGNIYCTKATADLLEVMLLDSGYIHQKDAENYNRKAIRAGRPTIEPLYTLEEATATLKYIKPILYNQLLDIREDIKIVFNDAGHILGSAITELWVKEDEKEAKIVFSGDLGMKNKPILRDPTEIKKADYVIMETTYGGRNHKSVGQDIDALMDIIIKTTRRGGTVVIPSFAVGRTQELIYQLNRYYDGDCKYKKELEKLKVYVDSPMATSATDIFKKNAQDFDQETKEFILRGDNPLDFKNLVFTRSTAESLALNENKEPKIILSASGMCEAGRIRHHLKHNLWNKKNSIVFVGYQAVGTLGRYLIEGAKKVTLFGEEIAVNAEIYNLEGFSGHSDQSGLLSWLGAYKVKPKKVFLVHGELDSKEAFAKVVREKLGYEPEVVRGISTYTLDFDSSVLKDREEDRYRDYIDSEEVRQQLIDIHSQLDDILYNTNMAVSGKATDEKVAEINNILQELRKNTMNLAFAVTENGEE